MKYNFRHIVLSLSFLMGIAAPWAAMANRSGTLENRMTQLERVSDAHGQVLTQLQQQFIDLQRDIDELRGQIQQNQYQLNQAVERQKQLYQQMDSLGSGNTTAQNTNTNPTTETSTVAPKASTGDENLDYNNAVALVMEKKEYDQAIVAFQNFIRQYPNSTYQSNANYWLGQLNYNKGNRDEAASYFAIVAKNYPKSSKSPDALYKVGIILQDKGQTDNAKAVYQQVIRQYPNTESAKQAQKRLSAL